MPIPCAITASPLGPHRLLSIVRAQDSADSQRLHVVLNGARLPVPSAMTVHMASPLDPDQLLSIVRVEVEEGEDPQTLQVVLHKARLPSSRRLAQHQAERLEAAWSPRAVIDKAPPRL